MPKRSSIKVYEEQTEKKNSDSKSKGFQKSSEQNLNKRKSKRSSGLFFDEDIKEEDLTSSQNYWYRGELMKLVPDAFTELVNAKEVIVEQKIELMEALTGCETPNRYNVFLIDKERQKKFLFKCKETSNWFCRNCVPSSYRSFFLKMNHIISSNKSTDYKQIIADFERPFMFTCLCCCRPKMDGFFKVDESDENNNAFTSKISYGESMGKVVEPFSCGPTLLINGSDGKVKWKIYGEYCQCGFWARDISVGKCYEVDFWIYENDGDTNQKPVGNIHKIFKGLSELVTDSDAFILTFPKKANAIERIMLIGAVIMIDYRFYEDLACCDCISIL